MRTIRGRLLVMLLCGLAVVLAAGGAAVYWMAQASLLRQLDASLATQADALASLVTYDDDRIEFEFDPAPIETIGDPYIEFQTHTGEMLRRSENLANTSLPIQALNHGELLFDDVDLPGSKRGRASWLSFQPRVDPGYARHVKSSGESIDFLVVVVAVNRGATDQALAAVLTALILAGGVVGVTVIILVTVGVRWGLIPLERLSRQLATVSGKTISNRFDDSQAPRELLPVYRELNHMLDRVERTLDRERSFANAAAHELRTPLAELRSAAEVALRWPDSQRADTALSEALAIGREMERLVESLLLISRGDACAVNRDADDAALKSIVDRCLDGATSAIDRKQLDITVELSGQSSLPASREVVEIIVRNLINNAVQYTPTNGCVFIRNGTMNGSSSLVVENGPVQLTADDLPHMFEPFWRTEQSRSDREHVGLGLTVVQRMAQSIGLNVSATLAGDRLCIRVSQE